MEEEINKLQRNLEERNSQFQATVSSSHKVPFIPVFNFSNSASNVAFGRFTRLDMLDVYVLQMDSALCSRKSLL